MIDRKWIFYAGLFACTFVLGAAVFFTEGTGGGGDSVLHFLIAEYAWKYPFLFFDHWGKPFYTLLASPFAQFGFKGIEVFNCMAAFASCWLTYRSARLLHIRNAHWIWLLYFLAPGNSLVILSGLTEPLFALVMILGIWLYLEEKPALATCVISFLPFVRSEGLIILGVCAIYLLVKQYYKWIPLLVSGHILYGIAGLFYHGDMLWVFSKIPYAKMTSTYGQGTWDHFFIHLDFMMGPVLYVVFWIGFLFFIFKLRTGTESAERTLLVYLAFVAFFTAHTAFWALGIFASMGLSRVFAGVMPLMAIIIADGLDIIGHNKLIPEKFARVLSGTVLIFILVFPFLDNPASFNFRRDFRLTPQQAMVRDQVVPYLRQKFPQAKFYYSDYSFAYFAGLDPFRADKINIYDKIPSGKLKENEVVVWDNWFSHLEEGISRQTLVDTMQLDRSFFNITDKGDTVEFAIFTKR